MKVGITLPQFRDEADSALEAARLAEALGIDGVFCFDHLWPMGQPGRPVISSGPLLGALAAATSTIRIGTLVARIGLVPDGVLVSELSTLAFLSGGRMIAGIGTGDHLSRAENDAFGIAFESVEVRRDRLRNVASALADRGLPVWIGGGSEPSVSLARLVGGAVNLWEGDPRRVAELSATGCEVTWGGPLGGDIDQVTARLNELAVSGATWAVCGWPDTIEVIAEAARLVRRM
jgi:enoyl-CoA hydratase/carnithine racemase